MRTAACLVFMGACSALADGIAPRPAASDYPAFQRTQDFFLGATLLSADQVKRALPAEIAKKYIVVEVAFYPRDGVMVEVFGFDFSLRFGKDVEIHPVAPEDTVSGRVTHGGGPRIPDKIRVEKEVGVIVANGRDPMTGRRGTSVGTYEGIGVGIGDSGRRPPPNSRRADNADRLEAQMRDKSLPEGKTTVPVAGYLYFPKKGASGAAELKYLRNATQVLLRLPTPK